MPRKGLSLRRIGRRCISGQDELARRSLEAPPLVLSIRFDRAQACSMSRPARARSTGKALPAEAVETLVQTLVPEAAPTATFARVVLQSDRLLRLHRRRAQLRNGPAAVVALHPTIDRLTSWTVPTWP